MKAIDIFLSKVLFPDQHFAKYNLATSGSEIVILKRQ